MKLSSKAELKALIKECLIEILTERSISVPTREAVRRPTASRPEHRVVESVEPVIPEGIPASMRSLFVDSAKRQTLSAKSTSLNAAQDALANLASEAKWDNLAGAALDSKRSESPAQFLETQRAAASKLPPKENHPISYDSRPDPIDDEPSDGFDPYEAIMARRRMG